MVKGEELSYWAVLVGHAFDLDTSVSGASPRLSLYMLKEGSKKAAPNAVNLLDMTLDLDPQYSHPANKLRVCSAPPNDECLICLHSNFQASCLSCLSKAPQSKHLCASGVDQVFRVSEASIYDLSIARLATQPKQTAQSPQILRALNVLDFKNILMQAGKFPTLACIPWLRIWSDSSDYEPGKLDHARERFAKLDRAKPKTISPDRLMTLHEQGLPVYLFKKSAISGWTWGLLSKAGGVEFDVLSVAVDIVKHPLSKPGDCRSIWFGKSCRLS